jgi:similar to spore coat protein
MNNDFLDPINAENMPFLVDSLFAMDFLMTAKTGVRTCSVALTEASSPEAKAILRQQLQEAATLHEEISLLMVQKGWLHPHDLDMQFRLDLNSADTMVKIAEMKLFPDNTSRRGTFATPNI